MRLVVERIRLIREAAVFLFSDHCLEAGGVGAHSALLIVCMLAVRRRL